jgi:retron-type reverse transcriptase
MAIDGKTSLSFKERFILQELLKAKWLNWKPQGFKVITSVDRFKKLKSRRVFTIADQVWQTILSLLLNPVHQAVFHPRNVGFREDYSINDVQKIFNLNNNAWDEVLNVKVSEKLGDVTDVLKEKLLPNGCRLLSKSM